MDLRKHDRIPAERPCTATFQHAGQTWHDVAVSNLGAEGCCFEIPARSANGLKQLAVLESVELSHPGLPRQAVQAKIVWVHSKKGAERDFVETGIQFCAAPAGYAAEVDRYVAAPMHFKPRTSM